MPKTCPKLERCPFFVKYGSELPETCRALVELYCRGDHQHHCKRLTFLEEHGYRPPDDLMPNGDHLLD